MKLITLSLVLFAATSCTHVKIARSEKSLGTGTQEEITLHSFAFGYVPRSIPPEAEVCPKSRIETVELYQSATDVLLTAVTFGVYVPHRAEVVCAPVVKNSN